MEKAATLPFHQKDLVPRTRRDCSLFFFMSSAISFFFVWELGVVLPVYHSSLDAIVLFHFCAGIFILLNIFGNIYFLKRVDPTGQQRALPAVLLEGWTYCYLCQSNAPPRAHHCTLCKECVLKRDHHCMFTGCCIGYFNHRYYVMTVFYILIGALYCAIYHWEYSLAAINGSGWWAFFAMIAPHFALLTGGLSLTGFGIISLHTLSLLTVVMMSYLLIQQLTCIKNGQTMFEKREAIFSYNLGFHSNFLDIFGASWKLALIWPWVVSNLPGDGIHFRLASQCQTESVKNI